MFIENLFELPYDKKIDLQCAHVYEHALIHSIEMLLQDYGYEHIEAQGGIFAHTTHDRICIYYRVMDKKLASTLDVILKQPRGIGITNIANYCREVEAESGRVFVKDFKELVRDKWLYFNNLKIAKAKGCKFSPLVVNYDHATTSTLAIEQFEQMLYVIGIETPTNNDRIIFALLKFIIMAKVRRAMRNIGAYWSAISNGNQGETSEGEIFLTFSMVYQRGQRKELVQNIVDELQSWPEPNNLVQQLIYTVESGGVDLLVRLHQSYGIISDSEGVKSAISRKNVETTLKKITKLEASTDNAIEADFVSLTQDQQNER